MRISILAKVAGGEPSGSKPVKRVEAKGGGGGADRSAMLRLIMPALSGENGKRFEVAIKNGDKEAFLKLWQAAGSVISNKI